MMFRPPVQRISAWPLCCACLLALPPAALGLAPSLRPRSAILLLVDGMSWGQLQLALDAARGHGEPPALGVLLKSGHTAYCQTAPLGALVAESGAGASAIATGAKVANRSLSQLPDGTRVPTILELAHRAGLSTGLVTTGRLTHATPAAFLSHMALRDDEREIARRIVGSGVDVLMGGGRGRFFPSALARARAGGYDVLFYPEQLEEPAPEGRKLLGLFADESFPFAVDRGGELVEEAPSLARMTAEALTRLSRNPRGFVLVVESRLVDEASHYHDAGAVLSEMLETDRAAATLLAFVRDHPETLLIVTSNHDTAGMGMRYRANPAQWGGRAELDRIRGQKASLLAMLAALWRRGLAGHTLDLAAVRQAVQPNLAADAVLSDQDLENVLPALSVGPKKQAFAYSPAAHALAAALEPHYLIGWNTGTHTSSPVPCFGVGPGSEGLAGLLDDTDLFRLMRAVLPEPGAHQ